MNDLDNELEKLIDELILNETTVVNKFKQTMTLYNADTRPADVLYPRHPSAGNRIDKQSGDAVFFFSTQEEAIKYVVGKGLTKEYIDFCADIAKEINKIEKEDPEKAKRIRFYIAQINKFTEEGRYPPVFRKIGVHMKYFGIDDAKAFPEFPFCRMFIERARRSTRPCYIRICNVPTADIKHGHCANYKEFTVFKPCKVDKMLTFTLGQLFSKVPVKYFTEFDDFKKFLPTITKNFDKDLFRGLITYQDFRKRLQWSDGKTSHEKLNSIATESYIPMCELEGLMEDVLNEDYNICKTRKIDVITESRNHLLQILCIEEELTIRESALLLTMIENDLLNEGYELEEIYNEKVFSNIKQKYNDFKEKNKDKIEAVKDYAKLGYKGAKDSAKAAVMAAGTGYIVSQSKLGRKLQDGKVTGKVADFMGAGKVDPKAYTPKALAKGVAIGAGLSVAGGMLSSHLAKKAREREEKERQQVNESTLFDIVLECEEELLDEGYSFEEIYGEDADSFEEFDIDDNVEQLTDAAAANFMEWQKGYAGKTINKIFKKRRDKVRAKVKAGKPLNKQEQELWDRMQAIQSKRIATLRANKAAKKNNN